MTAWLKSDCPMVFGLPPPPPYNFCTSGIILMDSKLTPELITISDFPFLPVFVVIMIAPLLALEP